MARNYGKIGLQFREQELADEREALMRKRRKKASEEAMARRDATRERVRQSLAEQGIVVNYEDPDKKPKRVNRRHNPDNWILEADLRKARKEKKRLETEAELKLTPYQRAQLTRARGLGFKNFQPRDTASQFASKVKIKTDAFTPTKTIYIDKENE